MFSAKEYYISKALLNHIKEAFLFLETNDLVSNQKTHISLEDQDVIRGYISRLKSLSSIIKDADLKDAGLNEIIKFKREVIKIEKEKNIGQENIKSKISLINDINGKLKNDLEKIVDKQNIEFNFSSRFVSFICSKKNKNKCIEKKDKKIKLYFNKNTKEENVDISSLNIDEEKLLNQSFSIYDFANTKNGEIFYIEKEKFFKKLGLSETKIKNKKNLKVLKAYFYDNFDLYFAPYKVGLMPLFEYDAIKNKKEKWNKYLYSNVIKEGIARVEHYDVLDLIQNNYVPPNIALKQVLAKEAGVVYSNGWFNCRLVDKELMEKILKEDKKYDDPEVALEEKRRWKNFYKENRYK